MLRRLLKRYGFLRGDRLSLVVGNHDIYGGIQRAEDILTFPGKCSAVDYNSKITEFSSYFPEAFDNCFYISQNNFYPFAKIVNNVLIFGMNSIAPYSKLSNPFASNGEIDHSQFDEAAKLLSSLDNLTEYKFILIHHHFNKVKTKSKSSIGSIWSNIEKQTMKLKGKRKLFNLFNETNVDLVLHGHLHETSEYYRNNIKFSNAGASIKNGNPGIIAANVISLNKGQINIEMKIIESSSIEKEKKLNANKINALQILSPQSAN